MKKLRLPLGIILLLALVVYGGASGIFGELFSRPNREELKQLAESRATWNAKNEERGGNYIYSSSFESWVGFGGETTLFVTNNVVTGRTYTSYDANRMPSDSYEEDDSSVGSNSFGAPPLTIDQLYDACHEVLQTKSPDEYYITFQLFPDNLLNACEYFDKNCADDCSEGVRISTISFVE